MPVIIIINTKLSNWNLDRIHIISDAIIIIIIIARLLYLVSALEWYESFMVCVYTHKYTLIRLVLFYMDIYKFIFIDEFYEFCIVLRFMLWFHIYEITSSVATTPLKKGVCVGVRHLHLWLCWVFSLFQIITGVDVSVSCFRCPCFIDYFPVPILCKISILTIHWVS